MSETVETVKVVCDKSPDGFKVINKSDMCDKDVAYKDGKSKKSDGKKKKDS